MKMKDYMIPPGEYYFSTTESKDMQRVEIPSKEFKIYLSYNHDTKEENKQVDE